MRLYNLPQTDNNIFNKSVDIEENKLQTVNDDFYSSTIYNSFDTFQKSVLRFENYIFGAIRKQLVETPLMPERGNRRKTFSASVNKGVSWGFRLVDYRNNNPLLTVVVDKDGTKYSYNSVLYNSKTKQYEDGILASKSASSTDKLLEFVVEKLQEDISKFSNVK